MLLRCMMILFLLMISVMPVWAGANTISPTEMTAEQITMEDALSKVPIEAEDWLDGDMYYTRYTFTNPTDVRIEKDILYTTVGLFAYWNDTCTKITKVDNSPNQHLSIAPHSETTMLLSFPKEYTHEQYSFRYAYFYFSDKSSLAYDTYTVTPEIPVKTSDDLLKKSTCPISFDISVIPPKEKNGPSELLLTIDNQTPQKIHSMKNLRLWGDCYAPSIDRNARLDFAQPNSIKVDIPPYSQKTITYPFFADFEFNYGRIPSNPYTLSVTLDDKQYMKPFVDYDIEIAYRAIYHAPKQLDISAQNTVRPLRKNIFYYIKDGKVHCFFKMHNNNNNPCYLKYTSFYWNYLTPFSTRKLVKHFFSYREPIYLRANESRYYTFSFDLPSDYGMPDNTSSSRFSCSFYTSQNEFCQYFYFKEQYLSPLRHVLYQPLHPGDTF